MADAKKPDKKDPDPIDHFYAKQHSVGHILRTREEAAVDAHRAGIASLVSALKKKDKNATETSIKGIHLQNKDLREIYQKSVINYFVGAAKKELKIKDDHKFGNDAEADIQHGQMLKLYTGLSKDNLAKLYDDFIKKKVGKDISKFTGAGFASFLGESDNYKTVRQGLNEHVYNHITESHLEKILDKTGASEFVNRGKDGKYDFTEVQDKRGLAVSLLGVYGQTDQRKLTSDEAYSVLGEVHKQHKTLVAHDKKMYEATSKLYK